MILDDVDKIVKIAVNTDELCNYIKCLNSALDILADSENKKELQKFTTNLTNILNNARDY